MYLESLFVLVLEAILRGIDAPNKLYQLLSVILLCIIAFMSAIAGIFLALRILGRKMGNRQLVIVIVVVVALYFSGLFTMLGLFIHHGHHDEYIPEMMAMWALFMTLLHYMRDNVESARARKYSVWAVVLASFVVIEIYVKAIISSDEIKGQEKSVLSFPWLLRPVSKGERYAAITLIQHATFKVAAFMFFHFPLDNLLPALGKFLSLLVALTFATWILLLVIGEVDKIPLFFAKYMPAIVCPLFLVFSVMYFFGFFTFVGNILPVMGNELGAVWLGVKELYDNGVHVIGTILGIIKNIFGAVTNGILGSLALLKGWFAAFAALLKSCFSKREVALEDDKGLELV